MIATIHIRTLTAMDLLQLILGRRLPSSASDDVKIGVSAAVPAMGLDALSSAAYGPEAALAVLAVVGARGLTAIGPIMTVVLAMLMVLYLSYRQTITAYPTNGGSYTVSKENLGTWPSLLAAAALAIDYVLTVAVGISAGVAALVSAAPSLHKYTIPLCMIILVLITLMNLRGTGEAGLAFAVPTYLFILSLLTVLAIGVIRSITNGGHPHSLVKLPELAPATQGLTAWLFLRAFASGCTAMTGVEAISNGVAAFKEPRVKNAHRTLSIIVVLLVILLAGVAYLARAYQIGAMDQAKPGYQSTLSQITSAVVGRGTIYFITIGSVLACLCLSANTSFVDFPRLCRLVARDGFLPIAFTIIGRRLVYSVGIIFLALCAAGLLLLFGGITDRLIPLYAVGAFMAFSLSQAGMVVHWYRQTDGKKLAKGLKIFVNGIGALATAVALVIILSAKFLEGAWITVITIPVLLTLFWLVNRHYIRMARAIKARHPLDPKTNHPPVVLMPTKGWDRPTAKALRFSMWLSQDVIALHLTNLTGEDSKTEQEKVRHDWIENVEKPTEQNGLRVPKFVPAPCPYRLFVKPIMEQVEHAKKEYPGRTIAVVIPALVENHWWDSLLHRRLGARLRRALMNHDDHEVVVVEVPWFIND